VYNRDTSSERKLRNARYARAPIGMFMTRERVVKIERRSGRQISDDRDACEEGEKSIEERVGDTFVVRLERKSRRIAYLRPNFCFFSAGFRIWNEHSKLSSTLIIAPALSNSPQ